MIYYILSTITILILFITSISALNFGELCDSSPIYSLVDNKKKELSMKKGSLTDIKYNDRATWQYSDSCANVYLFCDASRNNTCNYKTCSNSDYIQGWDEKLHKFPDRCNNQMYCPDNGAQCTPLVPVGDHCELVSLPSASLTNCTHNH